MHAAAFANGHAKMIKEDMFVKDLATVDYPPKTGKE
jgi:hypothetical protein